MKWASKILDIMENKKVSVGNVATAVKGLGLEQKVTEAVIERVDEELVEKYCGGKYARGNSKKRYQRAGSVERHPVTSVGKLNLRLHQPQSASGDILSTIFRRRKIKH